MQTGSAGSWPAILQQKNLVIATGVVGALLLGGLAVSGAVGRTAATAPEKPTAPATTQQRDVYYDRSFDVDVLVDGRALAEYAGRGRTYIQAIEGAEYEVRIHNPLPIRVAVALSVDGLNSIDAKHTTAWQASKWVIEPYGTINISGWQVSSARARHFYFTTERDSYGAKLGQTSNLGVISAVFFRERQPVVITPPEPRPVRPYYDKESNERAGRDSSAPSSSTRKDKGVAEAYPVPDDESAATGIGRSVSNDVRWVQMDLDSRPAAEVTIRYEYYPALVRLGILPRNYPRPDSLPRRERARGFEDRGFSPEP